MKKNTYHSKKSNKKVFSIIMSGLMLLTAVGTCTVLYRNYQNKQDSYINDDLVIKNEGVALKFLNKTTNSYGEYDQTFTYSVTPENATNQAVTAVAKYTDGTSCDSVMSVSVNTSTKTIILSCKGAFSKKINVVVTSSANSSATGTVVLDYVKKLTSIAANNVNIQLGGTTAATGFTKVSKITWTDFYTPNYSIYTKDKTYNFTAVLFENGGEALQTSDVIGTNINTGLVVKFETLLKTAFTNQSEITDDMIWNLDSSNAYHSALLESTSDSYVSWDYTVKVTCGDKEQIVEGAIAIGLGRDWGSREVGVDSVNLETNAIEF